MLLIFFYICLLWQNNPDPARGWSRTAATSKMELFVIIVNGLEASASQYPVDTRTKLSVYKMFVEPPGHHIMCCISLWLGLSLSLGLGWLSIY